MHENQIIRRLQENNDKLREEQQLLRNTIQKLSHALRENIRLFMREIDDNRTLDVD